ncbi:toll/interleukin-1 receptor domain-containing protein [Methanosarcina sp. KYL-1]|uniref:toll/interleukin-1 receptor domain-containing protein n=1 Tax=Methanosarcina sp. KYL-1 TaxID=2602068 RepID=UPI002100E75F|nr:toll/interleukin-1 receptor domain-containing protein [Methanosarcina sp. KYL-1]MCQ1535585.1 toll/interleukin-1 receptor domain-containing protein [Methanosarcina sp. KYL-1]
MITRVYISHCEQDELLAQETARALWAVELESFSSLYRKAWALSRAERIRFGVRQSDCVIAILTPEGAASPEVNQEIGLAVGTDQLVIPLVESGVELPVLIRHLQPISFSPHTYEDALGKLIQNIREITRLDWLKIKCPYCGEEMTQYISPQEEVEKALLKGMHLETMCSYCQRAIFLDPRTFRPLL